MEAEVEVEVEVEVPRSSPARARGGNWRRASSLAGRSAVGPEVGAPRRSPARWDRRLTHGRRPGWKSRLLSRPSVQRHGWLFVVAFLVHLPLLPGRVAPARRRPFSTSVVTGDLLS